MKKFKIAFLLVNVCLVVFSILIVVYKNEASPIVVEKYLHKSIAALNDEGFTLKNNLSFSCDNLNPNDELYVCVINENNVVKFQKLTKDNSSFEYTLEKTEKTNKKEKVYINVYLGEGKSKTYNFTLNSKKV